MLLLQMLFAYLVGSCVASILISKIMATSDPRQLGSKNAGATLSCQRHINTGASIEEDMNASNFEAKKTRYPGVRAKS